MLRNIPLLTVLLATRALLSAAAPVTTPSIQWLNCSSHVPEPLQDVELPTTLPGTLHCGQLKVPMDYSVPLSSENEFTVAFAMNRPQNPRGLLNFNPGGPGDEAISYAWGIALNSTAVDYFQGLFDYDFLAMDVRGSGQSNPLNCSPEAFGATFPSTLPSNETSYEIFVDQARSYAESCKALTKPPTILQFMGSREVVQDWDSLRAALGYTTMSMMAISYGTIQAEMYSRHFPQRVGRFVLDAVFPVGLSSAEDVVNEIKTTNLLLQRADAFCLADNTCPFHAEGRGSVLDAFSNVLDIASNTSHLTNVTADDVRAMTVLTYLDGNPDFASFNLALAAALQGNFSAFDYNALLASEYTAGILSAMPLLCLDLLTSANLTFTGFQELEKEIATADPNNIKYTAHLPYRALCSKWPIAPTIDSGANSTDLPIILVTSDFDYDTPTEWANLLFERSPNATLVVRHGDGHTSLPIFGPVRDVEIAFLANGTYPKASNSTFLTVYPPGSGPRAMADPYEVPLGIAAGDVSDP